MTTPTERATADAYSAVEALIEEARDNLDTDNEEYITAYRATLVEVLERI